MEMDNQKNSSKPPLFVCKSCDFKCCKQNDFKRHTETNKHKRVTESNKKTPNKVEQTFSCICGNIYKYRPGLAKHKRTCVKVNAPEVSSMSIKYDNKNVLYEENKDKEKETYTLIEDNICSDNNIVNTKNMFMELINDNKEMMKIIKGQQEQINSIIPKIGNITNNNNTTMNNNFNLNVFLNEQCKDALNISDFIDSLKITLEDLLFSKTNGISRGITDVLIKGLKELDIYKRPIHCTDIKRDIMYIKDEDKWHKDENHDMMKNTIVKIADKERTALQQWAIDNPDWIETERKQIEYLTMMRSVCEPIENYNNYERKIIKNLGKEILIDKKI
uniref:C2H2-type domain-containing protein n=1 Tax=viral metagenome TaxID=1070528 RepID=A0A6C0EW86_9ZZZZ